MLGEVVVEAVFVAPCSYTFASNERKDLSSGLDV